MEPASEQRDLTGETSQKIRTCERDISQLSETRQDQDAMRLKRKTRRKRGSQASDLKDLERNDQNWTVLANRLSLPFHIREDVQSNRSPLTSGNPNGLQARSVKETLVLCLSARRTLQTVTVLHSSSYLVLHGRYPYVSAGIRRSLAALLLLQFCCSLLQFCCSYTARCCRSFEEVLRPCARVHVPFFFTTCVLN
jgi:hypothetical protein